MRTFEHENMSKAALWVPHGGEDELATIGHKKSV